MKTVYLVRKYEDKQTLGVLIAESAFGLFVCKTLELKNANNQSQISCIPEGEYLCKFTRSNRFSLLKKTDFYTYEVQDVPNRAGIRIHSANYASQLQGCIALGSAHKDINADAQLDVIHSGATMAEFEQLMDKKDFKLIIKSI